MQKVLTNWLCDFLVSSVLRPEITGKHSEKFLKNAENKYLVKIKRIPHTEIQANREPIFSILPAGVEVGAARPLPPPVTPLVPMTSTNELCT